jgi:hypothetical protein
MFFLDLLFGKKIIFNAKMLELIEQIKSIDWFCNCGKLYNEHLYYEYIVVGNKIDAVKQLKKERNYRDFTSLTNLTIEANRRLGHFLDQYHEKDAQWTWNNLVDSINKRFMNNSNEFDFESVDRHFSQEFNIENKQWIYRIFRSTMIELYFLGYIPDIPTFYTKIFKIFQDGHVITGWDGKFPSHETSFSTNPIKTEDGKLLIW